MNEKEMITDMISCMISEYISKQHKNDCVNKNDKILKNLAISYIDGMKSGIDLYFKFNDKHKLFNTILDVLLELSDFVPQKDASTKIITDNSIIDRYKCKKCKGNAVFLINPKGEKKLIEGGFIYCPICDTPYILNKNLEPENIHYTTFIDIVGLTTLNMIKENNKVDNSNNNKED